MEKYYKYFNCKATDCKVCKHKKLKCWKVESNKGVKTKPQKDFLVKNGCHNIQGYFYSKPVIVDEIEKYLEKESIHSHLALLQNRDIQILSVALPFPSIEIVTPIFFKC